MTDGKRTSFIEVPESAAGELRQKFGVASGEKLRLCYLSIADDAARVQQNWMAGRADFKAIKQAHAAQFFELVEKLDAEGLMFSRFQTEPVEGHPVMIRHVGDFPNMRDKPAVRQKMQDVHQALARFKPHAVIMAQSLPVWLIPSIANRYPTVLFLGSLQWPLDWQRGSLKERIRLGVRKARGKGYFRNVRGIVSGSQAGLDQAAKMAGQPLPTGWDMPQFTSDYEFRERHCARKLIYCGPLSASDMVFDLQKSVRKLMQDHPEITLDYVGYGPDAHRLEQAVQDVPEIRVFEGASRDQFRDLMGQADLCIVSYGRDSHHGALDMLYAAGLSGVPGLVSSALPLQSFQEPSCMRFKASDPIALEGALTKLIQGDRAYRALASELPVERSRFYNKKHSFGSGLARILREMTV